MDPHNTNINLSDLFDFAENGDKAVRRLVPDWDIELSDIGFDESTRALLVPSLIKHPQSNIRSLLACLAGGYEASRTYEATNDMPSAALERENIFNVSPNQIAALNLNVKKGSILRIEQDSVQAFPCSVVNTGSTFLPSHIPRGQIDGVIRLCLEDGLWQSVLGSCSEYPRLMIPQTFGYLGYRVDKKVGSCEVEFSFIRSDVYDHISDRALKRELKDWSVILIAGAERIISQSVLRDSPGISLRFCIWPENIMSLNARRIRNNNSLLKEKRNNLSSTFHGVSKSQCKTATLYSPKRLGYSRNASNRCFLIKDITESSLRNEPFEQDGANFSSRAFKRLSHYISPDIFPSFKLLGIAQKWPTLNATGNTAIVRSLERSFDFAPALPSPIELWSLASLDLRMRHQDWLKRAKPKAGQEALNMVLPIGFAPISLGVHIGEFSDWTKIPKDGEVVAVHLKSQNRHPSIRVGTTGRPIFIGFKGAGIYDREGLKLTYPEGSSSDETILPVQVRRADGKEDPLGKMLDVEVESGVGETWGGATESELSEEFLNTIILFDLLDRHAPHLTDYISIPLNVFRYDALPSRIASENGWEKTWHGVSEYCSKFLGKNKFEPKTLSSSVAIHRCDVRLGEVVRSVFNRSGKSKINLKVAKDEIDSALSFLYRGFSEDETHFPEKLPISKSLEFGNRELLLYLKEVGELNRKAATSALEQICFTIPAIVGLVHGSGGSLGGGRLPKQEFSSHGEISGGALAIRNIDAWGGIHDLDGNMDFLWSTARQYSEDFFVGQKFVLPRLHAHDLFYMLETIHWFSILFNGASYKKPVTTTALRADELNHATVFIGANEPSVQLLSRLASRINSKRGISSQEELINILSSHPIIGTTYERHVRKAQGRD